MAKNEARKLVARSIRELSSHPLVGESASQVLVYDIQVVITAIRQNSSLAYI